MHARTSRDGVVVAYGRRLDAAADLEQVVVPDAHHFFAAVDDDGSLFDDAARADYDWPSESKDGGLGMNHRAWPDGNVAFEIDILTNNRLRVDRKLVPYGRHNQGSMHIERVGAKP